MTNEANDKPWFSAVLHATDLSAASETAFCHALALAVVGRAEFTIMHVGGESTDESAWDRFPHVRETLTQWGLLLPGSKPSDVFDRLGMSVRKVEASALNPVQAILDYLGQHEADLLVLATEGREGLPRWLKPSLAEPLARRSRIATLFVPQGIPGFVALDSAAVSLKRILIPIDEHPDASAAIELAARWGEILGNGSEITLLHLGTSPKIAEQYGHHGEKQGWSLAQYDDEVVEGILAKARQENADLIVMPTAGREGILDLLRGSTSEQVLRRAPCPLLAVPSA